MRTILMNTSSNVFKFGVTAILTFIMTPVYLHALGNYDYGVWEIVLSLTGYLGLLDIGLRPTISRFIARVSPVTEGEQWLKVYSTSFFLMMGIGILVGCVFFAWSLIAPERLAAQPAEAGRYALFLQMVALQVAMSFPRFCLESALEGSQRYVAMNNVTMIHAIGSSAFLYYFIPVWDPLLLLCLVTIVTGISKFIIFICMLAQRGNRSKLPMPSCFDRDLAREMYGFGIKSFVQNSATSIEHRTDVIIIGSFIGPASVVYYSIPQALLSKIRGLVSTLTHALMPAFSELDSLGQQDRAKSLFLASSRLTVGIVTLLCVGAVTLGGSFIGLWVGQEYIAEGRILLYILTGYLFMGMLIPLGGRYMTAVGRHGVLAKICMVRALINLGISLALVLPLGPPGVALGSLLATLATFLMESRAILGSMEMGLFFYLRSTLVPAVGPGLAMSLLAMVGHMLGWTDGWFGFLVTAAMSSLAFALLYLAFGVRPEERARFIRMLGAA